MSSSLLLFSSFLIAFLILFGIFAFALFVVQAEEAISRIWSIWKRLKALEHEVWIEIPERERRKE